jgi:hypothetical protein
VTREFNICIGKMSGHGYSFSEYEFLDATVGN